MIIQEKNEMIEELQHRNNNTGTKQNQEDTKIHYKKHVKLIGIIFRLC